MDLKVTFFINAFKLRVLAYPSLATDVFSNQAELDSHQANLDSILAPPVNELESVLTILADNTMLDTLFCEDLAEAEPTRA